MEHIEYAEIWSSNIYIKGFSVVIEILKNKNININIYFDSYL